MNSLIFYEIASFILVCQILYWINQKWRPDRMRHWKKKGVQFFVLVSVIGILAAFGTWLVGIMQPWIVERFPLLTFGVLGGAILEVIDIFKRRKFSKNRSLT